MNTFRHMLFRAGGNRNRHGIGHEAKTKLSSYCDVRPAAVGDCAGYCSYRRRSTIVLPRHTALSSPHSQLILVRAGGTAFDFNRQYRKSFSSEKGDVSNSSKAAADDSPSLASPSKVGEDSAEVQTTGADSDAVPKSSDQHIFPWRQDASPLPRVMDGDDRSGMPTNWRARLVRRTIAARELGVPFWQGMMPLPFGWTFDWESDLAGNFTYAFARALEELFIHCVRAPVTSVEGGISIETSVGNAIGLSPQGNDTSDKEVVVEDESDTLLNTMMDKELVQKYKSFDPDVFQLKLTLRPIDWKLNGIFVVPMLTREIVEKRPHLEGAYSRLEAAFEETRSINHMRDLTKKLAEDVGFWSRRTVIAEASIRCMEFFQVVDKRTGLVVQGMKDGADEIEVSHLVRFEVVTDQSGEEGSNRREVGSWKIIDWDDMLEGNIFH